MSMFCLASGARDGAPRRRRPLLAAVAVALTAALPGMADEESSPGVEVLARGVAVKDVCAWPILTALPDGTVIATIFNQPCHGTWEGDVECHATTDGGATWKLRGTPAPHEPGTNRMNVAVGRAASGDIVVLASGWSHRPPPPPAGEPAWQEPPATTLPIWVCRSADGGTTWTHAEGVELPSAGRPAGAKSPGGADRLIPFGDVIEIRPGLLGVCLYGGASRAKMNHSHFFTSADDGRTWRLASSISPDTNETTPLRLPGGDLLACGRTVKDQHLELFRSTDAGATWTWELGVSRAMQHPAHLRLLADGRVLLTYGDRSEQWRRSRPDGSPDPATMPNGILVRTSGDGGRTWTAPVRIAGFDKDGGYPATVEMADGRLSRPTTPRPRRGTTATRWRPSSGGFRRAGRRRTEAPEPPDGAAEPDPGQNGQGECQATGRSSSGWVTASRVAWSSMRPTAAAESSP